MKTNKLFKKLIAFFMTAALAVGCFSMTASAAAKPLDESDVTIADLAYYNGLIGAEPTAVANATININKYVEVDNSDPAQADTNAPVRGVDFSIWKIGDIFQVQDGTDTLMAYGISDSLAKTIGLIGDYTVKKDGGEYVLVKDYKEINEALMKTFPEGYNEELGYNITEENTKTTNDNGLATFVGQEYGLYLVVESSVAEAQIKNADATGWDWITITRKQAPYVVSAPIYDDTNKTWLAEIDAKAKNVKGTANIDKKIVRSYNGTLGYADGEVLNDTDITNVNDVVEFKFTSKVPDLTDSKDNTAIDIDKYVITDAISQGLTLPETFSDANIVITDKNNVSYTFGRDYTVAKGVDVGKEGYEDGSTFSITFTPDGLAKLTNLAKAMSDGEVYVYYTATVNSEAIVGEAGNPNKVKLTFQAGQSHEIDTQWDEVKEFIFGMEANKLFNNAQKNDLAEDVTFELYADADCTQAITVTEVANGNYIYAATDTTGTVTASTLKLDGNSQLYIKGVPTGVDLYLKETVTSTGYNILKEPVKVNLVPAKGDDGEYTGVLENGVLENTSTVNGTAATLVRDDTAITLAVNNTSGFQLPTTGGMGAWIFAILGVLVIGGGVTFYVITRKKRA